MSREPVQIFLTHLRWLRQAYKEAKEAAAAEAAAPRAAAPAADTAEVERVLAAKSDYGCLQVCFLSCACSFVKRFQAALRQVQ